MVSAHPVFYAFIIQYYYKPIVVKHYFCAVNPSIHDIAIAVGLFLQQRRQQEKGVSPVLTSITLPNRTPAILTGRCFSGVVPRTLDRSVNNSSCRSSQRHWVIYERRRGTIRGTTT